MLTVIVVVPKPSYIRLCKYFFGISACCKEKMMDLRLGPRSSAKKTRRVIPQATALSTLVHVLFV